MSYELKFFRLVGAMVRGKGVDDELPKRWVELIRHLDEKEQQETKQQSVRPSNRRQA